MSDLAEILMIEHVAIRHIRKAVENKPDYEFLVSFHEYLEKCHIEVEEKIVFPLLLNRESEPDPKFREEAGRILADHKLIQALFGNLTKWVSSEDFNNFNSRYPLYFRLLQDHNDKEDAIVFPHWSLITDCKNTDARKEAVNIIESFGKKKYIDLTGMTESGFSYLFR